MTMKKMISLALAVCMALALAVPVGAAVDVEEVDAVSETTRELIDNIYTHQDKYTIYDKDGNDITNDFIARNQEDYATGDIASIADDMVETGLEHLEFLIQNSYLWLTFSLRYMESLL